MKTILEAVGRMSRKNQVFNEGERVFVHPNDDGTYWITHDSLESTSLGGTGIFSVDKSCVYLTSDFRRIILKEDKSNAVKDKPDDSVNYHGYDDDVNCIQINGKMLFQGAIFKIVANQNRICIYLDEEDIPTLVFTLNSEGNRQMNARGVSSWAQKESD